MSLYKLTDQDGKTRAGYNNVTQWGEGITHTAIGDGTALCTDDVIHAYESLLVAAFLNPIHADFPDPIAWEAEGEIVAREGQLKCGVKTLTTIRRMELPTITAEQRIEIAIRCALHVYSDPRWTAWAESWLNKADQSAEAAAEAAAAARAPAWAAAEAAAAARAAEAAWAAAEAAGAAAEAAWAAARAAEAARAATWAAAEAAWAAGVMKFDLHAIIESVIGKAA